MNYLFAAYSLIWVLLFAYLHSIARRQKKVQEDLAQLRSRLEKQ